MMRNTMLDQKRSLIVCLCLIAALALAAGGCKKKAAETVPEPEPAQATAPEKPPEPEPKPTEVEPSFPTEKPIQVEDTRTAAQINQSGALKVVYFGFDKSDLTDTARATLRQNANWLKSNPDWNVVIGGHCDERGTIEYNLALGQRRANVVRQYLSSLGVTSARIRTVSYGEERPADPAHNEAAWAKNRRAESQVEE